MESQESPLFNYMLPVKICQAIPKPWRVQHETKAVLCFCDTAQKQCRPPRAN